MCKQLYKGVLPALLLTVFAACSNEQLDNDSITPGSTPVELSGGLTRAAGDNQLITTGNPLADYYTQNVKFFLSARTAATAKTYFANMAMEIGKSTSSGRNELASNVYYPLGKTPINLFAHTGAAAVNGEIPLTSGTNQWTSDVLLGKGSNESGTVTSGHSEDPIKYITFKHLMTKVDIEIEVDGSVETEHPRTLSLRLSNSAALNKGTYNMFTDKVTPTAGSGDYTLSVGTQYLLPSGAKLNDAASRVFSYVKIDDYVATAADLDGITIPQAEKDNGAGGTVKSDFLLQPGLSYTLTFQVKRLQLIGLKLTLNDWATTSTSGNWGYDPNRVKLNVGGGYTNAANNLIKKMVLKYNDGANTYQYIGTGEADGAETFVKFVTLPTNPESATSLTADLYTKDGLLIRNVTTTYNAATGLSLTLDPNGMIEKAGHYEVGTPLQFALMMKNPEVKEYHLINDIDMDNSPVVFTPAVFPNGATLNGNGYSILHFQTTGNGLVSTNEGTLRNVRIASGRITASTAATGYIGGMCASNKGIIEGCVNEADIEAAAAQIAGGICGENQATGKVLACLNTGNVSNAVTVGGICGENRNATAGAITACISTGLLNRAATNLGGICGKYDGADSKVINTCYWLTGTARKNQAISDEIAVGNKTVATVSTFTLEAAELPATTIRSASIISRLSTAAGSSWDFELVTAESSWPIPVRKP